MFSPRCRLRIFILGSPGRPYDDARDTLFLRIDRTADDSLRGVYSGYTIRLTPGTDPTADGWSQGISTEHTYPQSMGAQEGDAEADMHHLFPVRQAVNSSRSNNPYAEIPDAEADSWWHRNRKLLAMPTSNIDEHSESGDGRFEPRENHKGDAARAVFYFKLIHRWVANEVFFEEQQQTLLGWHRKDPPTASERTRSREIAAYQGNINPFIEDTSLVRRAFFEEDRGVPAVVTYSFDRNDTCPTSDDGPDTQSGHLTFSNVTRQGIRCETGEGAFNSNRWDAGDYVQFSAEPTGGYQIVFSDQDSLSFLARRSGSGPTGFRLTYQIGSGEAHVVQTWNVGEEDTEMHVYGARSPMLTTSEEVSFRIEAIASASHWAGTLRFDDLRIELSAQRDPTSTPITETPRDLPPEYTLFPSYPNPFSSSTPVPFTLPEPAHVRITLHETDMEQVRVVVDEQLPAGRHTVRLEAGGLASGTYIIRMQTNQYIGTRPVVLVE